MIQLVCQVAPLSLEKACSHLGVLAQVDEGIMLNHQCSDLPWFARQLAFWPFDFVVHQPSELLLELKKVSERLNKGCEQRRNLAQK